MCVETRAGRHPVNKISSKSSRFPLFDIWHLRWAFGFRILNLLGEMYSSMNKTYCFSEPTLFMVRHDGKDRHQRNSALKALHSTLRSLPLTILWDISYYFCSETLRMFNPITSSHDECVCRNLGIVHTLRFSSVHYLGVSVWFVSRFSFCGKNWRCDRFDVWFWRKKAFLKSHPFICNPLK